MPHSLVPLVSRPVLGLPFDPSYPSIPLLHGSMVPTALQGGNLSSTLVPHRLVRYVLVYGVLECVCGVTAG